jgi:hypothetical protein
VQYPLFLSGLSETSFLDRFSKNTAISNFMKLRPVGAELFLPDGQADGRTGRQKERSADRRTGRHNEANSGFSQLCESAYSSKNILYVVTSA